MKRIGKVSLGLLMSLVPCMQDVMLTQANQEVVWNEEIEEIPMEEGATLDLENHLDFFVNDDLIIDNEEELDGNPFSLRGRAYLDQCSGKYELSYVKGIDTTTLIACYDDVESARVGMNTYKPNSHMGQVPTILKGGVVIDTAYGVLDLYAKATGNSYYNTFASPTSTSSEGYIHGFYAGDAAYLGQTGTRSKLSVAGYEGYIDTANINIVPVSATNAISHYVVSNGILYHKVAKSVVAGSYSVSLDQGNAPSYLSENTLYFSFDGHYFYPNAIALLKDYQEGHRNNAINASTPYFNYYQFLSHRAKSNYDAKAITQFLNNRGFTARPADSKTTSASLLSNESLLVGEENALLYAQDRFGINAIMILATAINESAWGRSEIAMNKRNLFGHNAVDSSPSSSATGYSGASDSIFAHASIYLSLGYLDAKSDYRYGGNHLGNKKTGVNVRYASDPYWGEKAANYYYQFDRLHGMKDYQKMNLGYLSTSYAVNVRNEPKSNATILYQMGDGREPKAKGLEKATVTIIGEVLGDSINGNNVWYKVLSDMPIESPRGSANPKLEYDYNSGYAYVHSSVVTRITPYSTPDPQVATGVKANINDGWNFFLGKWYYYLNNQMQKGWIETGGNKYYLDPTTGILFENGWKTIDGNKYYFYVGGSMAVNTEKDGYLIDGSGVARPKPATPNGWNLINGYWYYYHFDVKQVGWLSLGTQTFYLSPNGAMVVGWQTIEGKKYYFHPNGEMARNTEKDGYLIDGNGVATPKPQYSDGWHLIDNAWYYLVKDQKQTGWLHENGRTFYLDLKTGKMVIGWQTIESNKYYFYHNGVMATSTEIDGYLIDENGVATIKPPLAQGWQLVDQVWYYYANGVRQSGWLKLNNITYYLDPTTKAMVTGWQTINGNRYHFYGNGHMATNTEIDGYVINSAGIASAKPAYVNGWNKINQVYYYYQNGSLVKGWFSELGNKYYLDPVSGAMATGWTIIDGRWYYFYANGKMGTGWVYDGEDYYYLNATGDMKIGWYLEGSTWYYLEKSGRMQTGWRYIDNVWYYFYSSGAMATNTEIDGWIINGSGAARPK